jgi:malonate-semialdehyde dehydrogenase (acetylating)/methylmalonate-semialdehyde dehydrogenase
MPDASLDFAADQITAAAYGSAGQRCMAISVVVAVGTSTEPLIDRLRQRAEGLVVGSGFDPDTDMGPLVTPEARERTLRYIAEGERLGARLVVDGRAVTADGDGFFVGPTLFDHVTADMSIYSDEIFGPVLCVIRVETLDDALDIINANPYGNGTAIFTASGKTARHFRRHVRVGMVGINVPIPVPMAFHSFGGWKQSLFGDHHVHGPEGVRFHTRAKAVTTRWPSHTPTSTPAGGFSFPTAA